MSYLEKVWRADVLFFRERFLSPDECSTIRRSMLESPTYVGTIVKRDGVPTVDTRVRRARNIDVPDAVRASVEARFHTIRTQLNAHFETRTRECQRTQFLLYERGDFFRRHRDSARESPLVDLSTRKISLVVCLNDSDAPDGFGGGVLSFIGRFELGAEQRTQVDVVPRQGLLIAFPPDLLHEVTRVTRGLRYTAVSWLI